MEEQTMRKIVRSAYLFPFLALLICLLLAVNDRKRAEAGEMSAEIKLSSGTKDCDYYQEDFSNFYFNLKYPKLLMHYRKVPVVAYVDKSSGRVVLVEVDNNKTNVLHLIPPTQPESLFGKWPIFFEIGRRCFFAAIEPPGKNNNKQYRVRVFEITNDGISLRVERTHEVLREISKLSYPYLWGIYPLDEENTRYAIVGVFQDSYFDFRSLIGGHFPTFDRPFFFVSDKGSAGQFDLLEPNGKFNIYRQNYLVSETGDMYASWVHDDGSMLKNPHSETIYYSEKKSGAKWGTPIKIYSVDNVRSSWQLRSLSSARQGDSVPK
jgi:hypothetical protein